VLNIFALLQQQASLTTRRLTRKLAACLIAGIFCAVAAAFGVAAFYIWLSAELGPIAACLILAGIFLMLAAIAMAVLLRREVSRPVVIPVQASPADPIQAATSILSALSGPKLSMSTILQLAAAGLLVGLAAGRRVTRK
jgi:hypothetical protein